MLRPARPGPALPCPTQVPPPFPCTPYPPHMRACLHTHTNAHLQDELTRNLCRDKSIDVWQRGVDTEVFNPRFRDKEMRAKMLDGEVDKTLLVYVGRLGAGDKGGRGRCVCSEGGLRGGVGTGEGGR